MDPTFETAFKNRTCLTNPIELPVCIQCIESLNVAGHVFTPAEFDVFIERLSYGKTRSCIANNDTGILNQALTIMFKSHDMTQDQVDKLVACCVSKQRVTMPGWVDIFLANCYVSSLNLAGLANVMCPNDKIQAAVERSKKTVKYVLSMLDRHFWSRGEYRKIWETLPDDQLNTNLLNDIIRLGSDHYNYNKNRFYEVITDLLEHGIIPDSQTLKMISKYKIQKQTVLTYLVKYNRMDHDVVGILCETSDMMIIFDPYYKIEFTTDIFNIIMEKCMRCEFALTIPEIQKLRVSYGDSHIEKTLQGSTGSFSVLKFWEYLKIAPNNRTFDLACELCNRSLYMICVNDYHMDPSIKHLNLILASKLDSNYKDNEVKIKLVTDILLCKIIPDQTSFKAYAHSGKFDNQILDLLVKFGLHIDYSDIKYLIERGIRLIPNLQRFGIPYDERLYCDLFVNNFELDHDEFLNQFTINYNTLKLRGLCGRPKTTLKQVQKFMKTYSVRLDRYCIDAVARAQNRELLYSLIERVRVPGLMAFVLLDCRNETYKRMVKAYGIDEKHMSFQYDVDV